MLGLGAVLVLSRGITEAADLPAAVAAAGLASALALLAVTWTRRTRHSPTCTRLPCRCRTSSRRRRSDCSSPASPLLATIGALTIEIGELRDLPAPARLVLRSALRRPARGLAALRSGYAERDFFAAPALRPGPIVAWLAGFALYQWLHPLGPKLVGRSGRARRTRPRRRSARRSRASRSRSRWRRPVILVGRRDDRRRAVRGRALPGRGRRDRGGGPAAGARARRLGGPAPAGRGRARVGLEPRSWTWTRTARPWSSSSIASRRLLVSHDAGSAVDRSSAAAFPPARRSRSARTRTTCSTGPQPALRLAERRDLLARAHGRAARDPRRRLGIESRSCAATSSIPALTLIAERARAYLATLDDAPLHSPDLRGDRLVVRRRAPRGGTRRARHPRAADWARHSTARSPRPARATSTS